MSHVFIGLSLLFIDQLQLIPRPVLDGLFLYLAVTALHCNQLFERIMLLVTEQVIIIIIIIIGAITVGTGGDWSPNFYVGGPTMYWSPNFLAVVFKKHEISQQLVTRMPDLASEFSKMFRGGTPGPSQRERATRSRTQPGLAPPVLGPKPWSPLTFHPWLRP